MGEKKFYICKHCGNMIGMIKSSGVNVVCCGDPMRNIILLGSIWRQNRAANGRNWLLVLNRKLSLHWLAATR